jgi:putative hemolysin
MSMILGDLALGALSLLLLMLEAFFSGSEIALLGSDLVKIRELARKGDMRAKKVHFFLRYPDRLLGTTLLGTNLCVVANASLITYLLSMRLGHPSEWLPTLILSPLVLTFGEALPKGISQKRPTSLALRVVGPLSWAYLAFKPFSAIFFLLARILVPGKGGVGERLYFTREDLALLMESEEGNIKIEEEEREIIHKVMRLEDVKVRETMKPINQVVVLEEGETVTRAAEIFHKWGYSRVPVYSGHIFNVVGVITIYDVLQVDDPLLSVGKLTRPGYFVPEYKRVDELLQELKEKRIPMALVVDEFGAVIGITTVEDLVEELVGEIQDDFDLSLPSLYELVEKEGGYVVNAQVRLDLLEERLNWVIPKEDFYETVSGFLLHHLGRIPQKGEKFTLESYRFTILDADNKSVKKVWIAPLEKRG